MTHTAIFDGKEVHHDGPAPYRARSASDRTDDWPLWIVVGSDNINRIRFPTKPGAVLIKGREAAEAIAEALNRAAGVMNELQPLSVAEQIRPHLRQQMFVVFDLDGTLALTEHRAHFLSQGPKDWRAFYAACDQDRPSHPIIQPLLALRTAGHEIEIWSGRSDEVRDKTTVWLEAHGLSRIPIRTRAEGDHRADTVLKAEWLNEGRMPDLVFEDRASVVAMWRSRGIVCCQVAPGDF